VQKLEVDVIVDKYAAKFGPVPKPADI